MLLRIEAVKAVTGERSNSSVYANTCTPDTLIKFAHEVERRGVMPVRRIVVDESQFFKNATAASEGKLFPRTNNVNVGAAGVGYGVPTYNLMKRYGVTGTSRYKDRKITRPLGIPVFYKNDVPLTLGTADGQFTFNSATGVVTINSTGSSVGVAAIAGASTVITFSSSAFVALFTVGDRLWLQSVVGTSATVLNEKSHLITNISGNDITIAVNTTGLTIEAGFGLYYPQPDDNLTWSGQFYVPVHFLDDAIDWDLALGGDYDNRLVAGPQVVLEEVRES